MNKTEALEKLTEIFRDILDDETLVLTEETSQNDIEEWDSLTQITLFATLEDEVGIEPTVEEISTAKDVASILALMCK